MLSKLFFIPDIMERYHLKTEVTARRHMKAMGASGSPFFVTEEMIEAWERTKRKPVPTRPAALGEMKIPRRK